MTESPFTLLKPFCNRLSITFFDKSDAINSNDSIATALDTTQLVSLHQIHGTRIVIASEPMLRTEDADGVWTQMKDLTLSIRVADCQSFVAYAPQENIVGLLHAGWRGLVRGAIPSFFQTLRDQFGIDPGTVLVGAGPSLCMKCAEFTDPITELTGIDPRFFEERHANLQAIADQQLADAGITQEHMERMKGCTKCDNDRFWSYRGSDKQAVIDGCENVLTARLL